MEHAFKFVVVSLCFVFALAIGKASRVGAHPGVTRALETRIRVSTNPSVFLLDTPGILMPNIKDMHVGMKLAACGELTSVGAPSQTPFVSEMRKVSPF